MKFENTEVFNFQGALRGMRNPKDSWGKSDSYYSGDNFIIGENDMKLARTLVKAGKEHRKFLRQIFISVDVTAPRYWWSEFDTYGIGVTKNSCSTMHKINAYPFTIDMFELDEIFPYDSILNTIKKLEELRQLYNKNKDIRYLRAIKQRLPESFLQKRTLTLNYEVVFELVRQREHHLLSEWYKDTMKWILTLTYFKELCLNDSIKKVCLNDSIKKGGD